MEVAAALTPPVVGQAILASMASRFGLEGKALELVREAFATADQIRASTSIVGLVLTVLFAVSFTTALQRCYLRVWRRPPQGSLRDRQRGFVWLAMMLLRGEVRWRPLLPTAIATGVVAAVYAAAASVWMPRVIAENVGQFGFVGVSLSFVTWFVGFGFLILASVALGPVLSEGDGRVARWLRGPDDEVLTPGARPALPGPATPPRLVDRFQRSSDESELTDS